MELGLFTHLANGPAIPRPWRWSLDRNKPSHVGGLLEMANAHAIAEKFPWDRHQTVIDIGTAEGCVPAQVALRHPHLSGGGFDLPAVAPTFDKHVALQDALSTSPHPATMTR